MLRPFRGLSPVQTDPSSPWRMTPCCCSGRSGVTLAKPQGSCRCRRSGNLETLETLCTRKPNCGRRCCCESAGHHGSRAQRTVWCTGWWWGVQSYGLQSMSAPCDAAPRGWPPWTSEVQSNWWRFYWATGWKPYGQSGSDSLPAAGSGSLGRGGRSQTGRGVWSEPQQQRGEGRLPHSTETRWPAEGDSRHQEFSSELVGKDFFISLCL